MKTKLNMNEVEALRKRYNELYFENDVNCAITFECLRANCGACYQSGKLHFRKSWKYSAEENKEAWVKRVGPKVVDDATTEKIIFNTRCFDKGRYEVPSTVLHEMLHAKIEHEGGKGGHTKEFNTRLAVMMKAEGLVEEFEYKGIGNGMASNLVDVKLVHEKWEAHSKIKGDRYDGPAGERYTLTGTSKIEGVAKPKERYAVEVWSTTVNDDRYENEDKWKHLDIFMVLDGQQVPLRLWNKLHEAGNYGREPWAQAGMAREIAVKLKFIKPRF